jgi:hypothetical protein
LSTPSRFRSPTSQHRGEGISIGHPGRLNVPPALVRTALRIAGQETLWSRLSGDLIASSLAASDRCEAGAFQHRDCMAQYVSG